jgi:hypothetical protein
VGRRPPVVDLHVHADHPEHPAPHPHHPSPPRHCLSSRPAGIPA